MVKNRSTTNGFWGSSRLYVSISTMLSNDIYRKFLAPKIHGNSPEAEAERISLIIAKSLVPVIGFFAVLIAMTKPPSLTLLTQIGNSGIVAGVFSPLVLGYFWPRANASGAFASFLSGAGAYALLITTSFEPNVFKALVEASIVGFVVMVVLSLATKPASEEHTRRFIPSYRTANETKSSKST